MAQTEIINRLMNAAVDTGLDCMDWDDEPLEELVRAIVKAMRDPTDAMATTLGDQWGVGALDHWQKMIDGALLP